ncbi:hypothetical protein [Salinicoccus roseus]|uniref:hypothetical protein n=1 Tax=Salinicoccus roseus TaxID=45670 RepID=UPI002301ECFC|nr:hypothetical protein [Salinicoccus roseus]
MNNIFDFSLVLLVIVVYLEVFKFQKKLFPSYYFGVGNLLLEYERGMRRKDIIIRIIITSTIVFVFVSTFSNPWPIILGVIFASVVIVSPIFIDDSNIEPSLMPFKLLYKISLVLFVLANAILSITVTSIYYLLTSETYIPLLSNYIEFVQLNTIIDPLFQIILSIIAQVIYVAFVKLLTKKADSYDEENAHNGASFDESSEDIDYNSESPDISLDLRAKNTLEYYKFRISNNIKLTEEELLLVKDSSNEYEIPYSYLLSIIIIEKFCRDNIIENTKEKIFIKFWKHNKINPSLGIGQIKVSTVKEYFPLMDEKEIIKSLHDKKFNINLCAVIIQNFINNNESHNIKLDLIRFYTTGNSDIEVTHSIKIYYYLFDWLSRDIEYDSSNI